MPPNRGRLGAKFTFRDVDWHGEGGVGIEIELAFLDAPLPDPRRWRDLTYRPTETSKIKSPAAPSAP